MDLEEQVKTLIEDAPDDENTIAYVSLIAPALKHLAEQLRHSQYYIVQTLDQDWVITTLSNNTQPEVEKTVVYAFPSLQDTSQSPYPMQDPNLIALPIPTIHILFQMLAMDVVDSTIFFETPGNLTTGTEIQRSDIQALVESTFLNQRSPNSIPPNIA
ncbi:MAG TPA: hypothetical protein IGS53_17690 [Leptolyngbyaceae cyanobacterium M33_DOE_097]|uniref:Uncharacterized protein n=1 Tax=Oscillatoriales cyanobacterium SpSt-418 TaxID=2282169 RepID=A0A7C3PJY8_9CYAN|nr:hypothetical protein [Leptolyngbyaceae cyanobacterium M33_DOE_097]